MNKLYSLIAILTALTAWSFGIWRTAVNITEAKYIKQANEQLINIQKIGIKSSQLINPVERSATIKKESAISIIQYRDKIVYKYLKMRANESICNQLPLDTFNDLKEVLK